MTAITGITFENIGGSWTTYVELESGTKVPISQLDGNRPDEPAPWELGEKEYEECYNDALELARSKGYVLEGYLR